MFVASAQTRSAVATVHAYPHKAAGTADLMQKKGEPQRCREKKLILAPSLVSNPTSKQFSCRNHSDKGLQDKSSLIPKRHLPSPLPVGKGAPLSGTGLFCLTSRFAVTLSCLRRRQRGRGAEQLPAGRGSPRADRKGGSPASRGEPAGGRGRQQPALPELLSEGTGLAAAELGSRKLPARTKGEIVCKPSLVLFCLA